MPMLPPEVYVPAFGFLVATGGGLVGAVKILYNRNVQLVESMREYERTVATEATKAILLGTVATNDHTKGIAEFTRKFDEFSKHYEAERRARARDRRTGSDNQ